MTARVIVRMPTFTRRGDGQVDVSGLKEFSRDLNKVSKDIKKEVKSMGRELMKPTVTDAKARARRGTKQQKAMAKGTIMRTEFYRGSPAIKAGGSQAVALSYPTHKNRRGKHKVPAGAVFFGAEFGAINLTQFPKRSAKLGRGNAGYFLWPAIRDNITGGKLVKTYLINVHRILSKHKVI